MVPVGLTLSASTHATVVPADHHCQLHLSWSHYPPTSAAAMQHSFKTYHSVQQWKGHQLDPT